MGVFSKIRKLFNIYPISRSVVSYTLIFPTSCLIQQTLAGKRWETYDLQKVFRFWIYGTFFLSPVVYGYVRTLSKWFPELDLKTNMIRIAIDQLIYAPIMTAAFFGGMALLEGRDLKYAEEEIRKKFLPTFKTGLCYWPIVQTVNFSYIPEKNRVPFLSLCGMAWTVFLSFVLDRKG
ncbi:hypothetical protein WA026_022141 [Henosepilachna vigintioctopunctata]|uniref:Mpv17-like protein n=1 Tax=Henosepilachna vigintioctopunctata TaxID=420089 RepID=A0AAW1TZM3_9CUCU